jgi:hypothetical protein
LTEHLSRKGAAVRMVYLPPLRLPRPLPGKPWRWSALSASLVWRVWPLATLVAPATPRGAGG